MRSPAWLSGLSLPSASETDPGDSRRSVGPASIALLPPGDDMGGRPRGIARSVEAEADDGFRWVKKEDEDVLEAPSSGDAADLYCWDGRGVVRYCCCEVDEMELREVGRAMSEEAGEGGELNWKVLRPARPDDAAAPLPTRAPTDVWAGLEATSAAMAI